MMLEPKILEIIKNRGIETEEALAEYLSDKPKETYDPFLLHNMEAGVDLIMSAIDSGKTICIYGDYDADGITSTVVLTEVLSQATDKLFYYIPSRFDEGYGLNKAAIDTIREKGADMIITVDCGSVSYDAVEHAKEIGLDIIVTDHHTIGDRQADCILINPKQKGDTYPCRDLAGCGVAFKLAQALTMKMGLDKSVLNATLDMVGIGTVGDIVPLMGENRTFAKTGLKVINSSNRDSLVKLIQGIRLKKGNIVSENISFGIVPHLNAAGRMSSAQKAVRLFLSEDGTEGAVEDLIKLNEERKSIQAGLEKRTQEIVERDMQGALFLAIYLPDAHEGVTGIVAGKIKELYNRPTVIMTDGEEGVLKGTGRSVEGVDIYSVLKSLEDLMIQFGGHKAACGFTMKKENLEAFRSGLEEAMKELVSDNPELLEKQIRGEVSLSASEVNMKFARELKLLEPCGAGNERPLVDISGYPVDARRIGNEGKYLKFRARLTDGRFIDCVSFGKADYIAEKLEDAAGGLCSITGYLGINTWNDREMIQMNVEEMTGIDN